MSFKVLKPGVYTTVQDLVRVGHQSSGFSPAGAMDYKSAMIANQLLNNDVNSAVLEFTMQGATLEVLSDTIIAIYGASMDCFINENEIPSGLSYQVYEGDILTFGVVDRGMRTYLAVQGGFDEEIVRGSRSTHPRSGIGGHKGRPLKSGDIIYPIGGELDYYYKQATEQVNYDDNVFHVIPGPQYGLFTEAAKKILLDEKYEISKDSDRMGMRLNGSKLETNDGSHDILSEPTQLGNIQVPKSGLPIILLNDRQTAGGYTRIATVALFDLPKLVQMKPGQTIQFKEISVEEATERYSNLLHQIYSGKFIEDRHDFTHYRRHTAEKISKLLK